MGLKLFKIKLYENNLTTDLALKLSSKPLMNLVIIVVVIVVVVIVVVVVVVVVDVVLVVVVVVVVIKTF